MHIISRKKLLEFAIKNPDAFTPLDDWYRISKSVSSRHIEDVRQFYPSAAPVEDFTVFNIKGNNYRLIVSIDYARQIIYVKYVLTHAEYDKENWKDDPHF